MVMTPLPPQYDGFTTVIFLPSKSGGLYVRRPKFALNLAMPTLG